MYISILLYIFILNEFSCCETIVHLNQGSYLGLIKNQHVRFLGLPYAEKPGRFEAPKPLFPQSINLQQHRNDHPSSLLINATQWKASCPSFPNARNSGFTKYLMQGRAAETEDCLYANVFIPALQKVTNSLSVLVFMHGGAFHSGSSTSLIYDPGDFIDSVSKDNEDKFIIVTFEYRLGPLGYLIIDEKDEMKGKAKANGNFGLMDQVTALNWIFDNIGKFGGDPRRISIMGHSAGAISASWIYVLEKEMLKFQIYSYIMMSGVGSMWPERRVGGEFEREQYHAILNETNCNHIECLRNIDIITLQKACRKLRLEYTWGPTIDNFLITNDFQRVLSEMGDNNKARLLITAVRDEGSMFIPSNYKELIDNFFSQSQIEEALGYYGLRLNLDTINSILTDGIFICPLYNLFRERKAGYSNASPNKIFLFNRPMLLAGLVAALSVGKDFGVFHGSDVLMLFGNQRELAIAYPEIIQSLRQGIRSFITNGTISESWQFPLIPQEHHCDTIWKRTRPLIPKNYKSRISLKLRLNDDSLN